VNSFPLLNETEKCGTVELAKVPECAYLASVFSPSFAINQPSDPRMGDLLTQGRTPILSVFKPGLVAFSTHLSSAHPPVTRGTSQAKSAEPGQVSHSLIGPKPVVRKDITRSINGEFDHHRSNFRVVITIEALACLLV
jgi:hypothetical protein